MTIWTALQRLDKLTAVELRHMIQLAEEEIRRYEQLTLTPDQYERYGKRHRTHLETQRERFETALLKLEAKS